MQFTLFHILICVHTVSLYFGSEGTEHFLLSKANNLSTTLSSKLSEMSAGKVKVSMHL